MRRSILIFGNGLGMALDPEHFRLSTGLAHAWNDPTVLDANHKQLISSAIPGVSDTQYPQSEEQLDRLQMAIVASDFLQSFETGEVRWLTEWSRELPSAFKRFVHAAAMHFHNFGHSLPNHFAEPLAHFIGRTKSHVALLNYDCLIYNSFCSHGILSGYSGSLIDGFRSAGFKREYIDRTDITRLGWYLHLHGSPLFVGNRKAMGIERDFLDSTDQSHIVLTHVRHKRSIIDKSPILTEYWLRLIKAFSEVENIVLFGYSGEDVHLNEVIAAKCGRKPIFIIEWLGSGDTDIRNQYWKTQLGDLEFKLLQLRNILEFDSWDDLLDE